MQSTAPHCTHHQSFGPREHFGVGGVHLGGAPERVAEHLVAHKDGGQRGGGALGLPPVQLPAQQTFAEAAEALRDLGVHLWPTLEPDLAARGEGVRGGGGLPPWAEPEVQHLLGTGIHHPGGVLGGEGAGARRGERPKSEADYVLGPLGCVHPPASGG